MKGLIRETDSLYAEIICLINDKVECMFDPIFCLFITFSWPVRLYGFFSWGIIGIDCNEHLAGLDIPLMLQCYQCYLIENFYLSLFLILGGLMSWQYLTWVYKPIYRKVLLCECRQIVGSIENSYCSQVFFDGYYKPLTVIPRFPHLCFNFSFSSIWCSAIPYFKGELRGKNEVILYSRPIFSTSKFGNSFHWSLVWT